MKTTAIFFLLFLVSCAAIDNNKSFITGDLTPGVATDGQLLINEPQIYTIRLDSNSFVYGEVNQISVDVVVSIKDSAENLIASFDGPAEGLETFTFEVSKKGEYKIEVAPFEKDSGKFSIEVKIVEPIALTPEKRIKQLFSMYSGNNLPGAAIAVIQNGEIQYKNGFGMSNLEYDIPITSSTIFHIASVSKQFTAFSILLLEKEGKLSLDDDIRKFIPEVPNFGKKITLRNLANHTSGLRDQWNLLALAGWRLDDVITKEQILKLVSNQKELNFNPGDEFVYCNTGYTLLAEVVARVSGKSFPEFTNEYIFKPLEMTNTLFYDDHEKIVKNRAYSYQSAANGYKKSVLSYANAGATSLFTTVEDLSLWAMNFENPVAGNQKIFNKLNQRAILNKGDTITYALGQDVSKYKGLNLISHSGGDAGYRTFLGRFPDQKFSVIVLSNSASCNPGNLALKVADVYLKDEIKTEVKVARKETKENKSSVNIDTLKVYAGQYEPEPGFIITITEENGKLYGQATGQHKLELKAVSSTEFSVIGMDAKLTFHRDIDNNINLLKLHQGGVIDAPRMKSFDKSLINLDEYVGQFHSDELSTNYTFVIKNDTLVATHARLSDIKMTPAKPDVFSGDKWFFGQTEFIRDKNEAVTGCRVSSGRARNIWFKKVM
jgi:CubicO group peptidase (beta-lactamase class C family)